MSCLGRQHSKQTSEDATEGFLFSMLQTWVRVRKLKPAWEKKKSQWKALNVALGLTPMIWGQKSHRMVSTSLYLASPYGVGLVLFLFVVLKRFSVHVWKNKRLWKHQSVWEAYFSQFYNPKTTASNCIWHSYVKIHSLIRSFDCSQME